MAEKEGTLYDVLGVEQASNNVALRKAYKQQERQ